VRRADAGHDETVGKDRVGAEENLAHLGVDFMNQFRFIYLIILNKFIAHLGAVFKMNFGA
jgi:hypothetical protein